MKNSLPRLALCAGLALVVLVTSGCNTVGSAASDLGLAGAGGAVGYELSDHRIGGAAAGAAVGYLGSRIAQSEISANEREAEQRGYDRARAQEIKERYWAQQHAQARSEADDETSFVPVVTPEAKINGVITRAHIEYLRAKP